MFSQAIRAARGDSEAVEEASGAGASAGASAGAPNSNDDENNKEDRERSKAPKNNKEADKAAKDLGYEKTNERSSGQRVYKNKKGKRPKYISRDVDSHNGGTWKGADKVKDLESKTRRTGTYDGNLNRVGD